MIPIQVKMKVSVDDAVKLSIARIDPIKMTLWTPINIVDGRKYEGEYVVTPTAETQVLQTADLKMKQNLTVNPIPSNYGLITWNGSFIMVS